MSPGTTSVGVPSSGSVPLPSWATESRRHSVALRESSCVPRSGADSVRRRVYTLRGP